MVDADPESGDWGEIVLEGGDAVNVRDIPTVPTSFLSDLAFWREHWSIPERATTELMRIISHHTGTKMAHGRTLHRRAIREAPAPRILPLTAEEWPGEDPFPNPKSNVVFSVWLWVDYILGSRFLRESLVVRSDDVRLHDDREIRPNLFRCTAFKEMLERSEGVDFPLWLVLYNDDFDPFTFARLDVAALYFTLGNFPRHISSKPENRFLLGLFDGSNASECEGAVRATLRQVVRSVGRVRTVGVDGATRSVCLHLGAVAADMLARNKLCSLGSPNSTFFCTQCYATKFSIATLGYPRTRSGTLSECHREGRIVRSVVHHKKTSFHEVRGLHVEDCRSNPLFELETFDPHTSVCIDFLHDELLGVCVWEITHCLNLLTRYPGRPEALLERMAKDDLWPHWLQRPRDFSAFYAPVGKASAILSFMVVAPVLFSGLLPADNMRCLSVHSWLVRSLVDMTTEQSRMDSFLENLDSQIRHHTTLLLSLYGEDLAGKRKPHNRLHYVAHIRRFGPLLNLCTGRFEAKHLVFKRDLKKGGRRTLQLFRAARRECDRQANREEYHRLYREPSASIVNSAADHIYRPGDALFEEAMSHRMLRSLPVSEMWTWNSLVHAGVPFRRFDFVGLMVRGAVWRWARLEYVAALRFRPHDFRYFVCVSYCVPTPYAHSTPDIPWNIPDLPFGEACFLFNSRLSRHHYRPLEELTEPAHFFRPFVRSDSTEQTHLTLARNPFFCCGAAFAL